MTLLERVRHYARQVGQDAGTLHIQMVENGDIDVASVLDFPTLRRMAACEDAEVLLPFLRESVFGDAVRRTFWLERHLHPFCFSAAATTATETTLVIVEESLRAGADAVRTACDVHSLLSRWPETVPAAAVVVACRVLRRLLHTAKAKRCIACPTLLRGLSCRMADPRTTAAVLAVFADGRFTDLASCCVAAERAARTLVHTFGDGSAADVVASLRFLETLAGEPATWHTFLADWVVEMHLSTWDAFAPLVEKMLAPPYVGFLLAMERKGKLDGLTTPSTTPSARIGTALARAWPAKRDGGPSSVPTASRVVCPITLHPCVHPVVASDGHTYERDAILTYMATFSESAPSPITKEALVPALYTNFAAMEP